MAMSPMMQEYCKTKEKYKDCVLFYRLGDFYEMFFDDALLVSKELELTLTGKDCGLEERAPMCGIPFHAADTYINRLIEKGYKVAICEQVEDPKKAKGLAEKTLQSYQAQFQAVARHLDVKMDIAMLQKADLDAMIISMRTLKFFFLLVQ